MKIPGIIARIIFILCLPAIFISASLAWGFNSHWLYEYGFEKYEISKSTGIPDSELNRAAQELITYFNSDEEYVNIRITASDNTFPLFTLEEQIHFKDVKDLVWLDYRVLAVALAIALIYALAMFFLRGGRQRVGLLKSVVWGSGLTLALIIILGIASLLDFNRLFLQFHYLAFSNQFWSAQGYMLMLFPGGFWFMAALICIGFTAGLAVICGASSLIYLRLARKRADSKRDILRDQEIIIK